MKLKSLNKNIEKFGFNEKMEYTNATFNGYQLGIAVCIKNNITGEIESNFLSETLGDNQVRNSLLLELLNDKSILLLENKITQFGAVETTLIPKTIYYLPYYVENHSVMQPTISCENISKVPNVSYNIKVEVLFVEDKLNRYMTIPFKTKNTSIIDLVYDLFEYSFDTNEQLEKIGIKYQAATEIENAGYVLDFYNQVGEKYNLIFSTSSRLRDAIVSMRLIDFSCCIDKEEENGNEFK